MIFFQPFHDFRRSHCGELENILKIEMLRILKISWEGKFSTLEDECVVHIILQCTIAYMYKSFLFSIV